ncbi:PotD/PotF family extracellular solute-binding protein [Paracoccus sp. (in: a-proteobacteria)]|uniref:ABC transporter substrate-binding protein n=1 Tax=Paracoccus sp. TaxID=267 RepID=UPI00396CB28F
MPDTPLRVIGTSVTLPRELQARVRADLGFPIVFEVLDGSACLRRGVTQPGSFDIYDQWFHSIDLLQTAGSIAPIEIARIERWNQMTPLYGPGATAGPRKDAGLCPADVLFVQDDNNLGAATSTRIAMLPTACNADSFAYRPEVAKAHRVAESWAWLLEQDCRARCLLSQDPASSVVELALAARSADLVDIDDCTNLTIEEIDALFNLLTQRRQAGPFTTRTWNTHEESVRLMAQPSTRLGSLWSPAYYELRANGLDLNYASPKEGYRGWQSGLSLSAAMSPGMQDRAYEYLNWWLSGPAGAILSRQGYYMSVTAPLQDALTEPEWSFWYEGEPASSTLPGLDGRVAVRAGERRAGGSHVHRMSRVSVWSTIMDENNYLLRKWQEFLT